MLQIVISITDQGQIQVATSQPLSNDRILGLFELAKMSVLEACKAPAPTIVMPNGQEQQVLGRDAS